MAARAKSSQSMVIHTQEKYILAVRNDKPETQMATGAWKGHRSAESRTLLLAQGRRGN